MPSKKYVLCNLGILKYKFCVMCNLQHIRYRFQQTNYTFVDSNSFDLLSSLLINSTVKIFKNTSVMYFIFLSDFSCTHILTNFYQFRFNMQFRNFVLLKWIFSYMYSLLDYTINFSVCSVFQSAVWLEREMYDLFGIFFLNHPNLRRLLTDYGFQGFPLRKDFPVFGFKELIYDYEYGQLLYSDVCFTQSLRFYSFVRQWGQVQDEIILRNEETIS